MNQELTRLPWLVVGLAVALASACSKNPKPEASPQPSAVVAVPSETAPPRPVPPAIVTLAPVAFTPDKHHPSAIFAIEGALMVVEDTRIGRITADGVDWFGSVPKHGQPGMGENVVSSVEGRWPDAVGAVTYASNGRAPYPTLFPLTWKSPGFMVGPGGQGSFIAGVVRVKDSLLLVAWSLEQGYQIIDVHGPKLARKLKSELDLGCKRRDVSTFPGQFSPGVTPDSLGSTKAGTMISIGHTCEQPPRTVAEIWEDSETSRIVDLADLGQGGYASGKMVKGAGDELFVTGQPFERMVRYHAGKFELLPDLGTPAWNAFTSPSGKLYAENSRAIFEFDGTRWVPVAKLVEAASDGGAPYFPSFASMVSDGDGFWGVAGGAVYRLSKVPNAQREPAEAASSDKCTTPLVYLLAASPQDPKKYDYPKVKKSVANFPDVAAITMLEFDDDIRRVGFKVANAAQGEALVAHLARAFPKEKPRLTCYEPRRVRVIPIGS